MKKKVYDNNIDKVIGIMKWKQPTQIEKIKGGWLCIWDNVGPVMKKLWDLDDNSAKWTLDNWLQFYSDFEDAVFSKTEVRIKIHPTVETGLRYPFIFILD